MKSKKSIIIAIIIIILIISIVIIRKNKNITETTIENNTATNDITIDKVTFSNISKVYENGITTLSAKMKNNTNKTKNFTVNITLKNDQGEIVQSLTQVVENLETGKSKILSTGIMGDYSNIKDIKFELAKE